MCASLGHGLLAKGSYSKLKCQIGSEIFNVFTQRSLSLISVLYPIMNPLSSLLAMGYLTLMSPSMVFGSRRGHNSHTGVELLLIYTLAT